MRITQRSRIVATVTLDALELSNEGPTSYLSYLRCHLETRDYGDGAATNHPFDDTMNVVQFSGKAGDQREVVLTGAVIKDPGTYDVQAWCTSEPNLQRRHRHYRRQPDSRRNSGLAPRPLPDARENVGCRCGVGSRLFVKGWSEAQQSGAQARGCQSAPNCSRITRSGGRETALCTLLAVRVQEG